MSLGEGFNIDTQSSREELERLVRKLQEANELLKDAEGRSRALIEASSQMIWTTDAEGQVIEDSPSWRKFTGQTHEEWLGDGWLNILHPEDQARTMLAWRKATSTVSPYEVEYRIRRADGQWRWVLARGVPQLNPDGTVRRWVGMNQDITESILDLERMRETQQQLISHQETLVSVLRESQTNAATLRVLFDQSFYFAAILDLEGRVIEVNQTALTASGFRREEIVGQLFWETEWWSGASAVRDELRSAIQRAKSGLRFRGELPFWISDGSQRMADFVLTPARNEEGEIIHLLPTAVDITERSAADEREQDLRQRLLEHGKRLELALKAGGIATWEWSESRSIWDDQLFELLGISSDLTPSTPLFFESVHPEDLPELEWAWADVTSGLRPYNHEFRIIRPDGEVRWLAAAGEFVRDSSGKVSHVYGLNWDITERKKNEQQEKRQQEVEHFLSEAGAALASSLNYEATLTKVTNLCVPRLADWAVIDLIDDLGEICRVSVACANPKDDELAHEVAQFSIRENIPEHPPARVLFSGKGFVIDEFTEEMIVNAAQSAEHEKVIRAVDPKSVVVVPLVARGKNFGVLTMVTSESGRRFGPDDLKLAEELGRRAASAIDNAQLFEAGQRANVAKSEFLANMSHEIRTPLTSVLGYAEMLLDSEQTPERVEHLKTIIRNGQFLVEIINEILDLAKIESGKLEIVRQSFDPRKVFNDVHSLMSVRAEEKNLDFQIIFEGEVPDQIHSDATRLKQILFNIIGNAIKFTEKGSIQVFVRHDQSSGQGVLQFDIVDTGIGISRKQLKQLFEPFYQADTSVTREYGGSGLGLTICRRLAELLGGDIEVESKLNKGSKFLCSIAAEIGEKQEPSTAESKANAPNGSQNERSDSLSPNRLRDCNVLIVDDRRDIRFLAERLLTKVGAEVQTAEDGLHAIEHVKNAIENNISIDAVVLDMQMPRLDGYQTASKLRELGFSRPIIALSANAMQGSMERCLEFGCNAYLTKPIDFNKLVDTLYQTVFAESTN
ncbi:PAS domain-containing hybrid sensor histidine kinase/response regulator [Calycomorphotria hydatis]|nr:PAS domain-containing protein [Calycomorphotria hydatis]